MDFVCEETQLIINEYILNKNVSFVLVKNGKVERYDSDIGVKPIIKVINECKESLGGADVGDKIIGKAAALLLIKYKVHSIFATVISKPACKVLDKHKILYTYNEKVENIRNRTNTDLCPLEKSVIEIDDFKKAEKAIRECIKVLMQNK